MDKLERAQDKLARKINKRVMGMIEKSERDYDDLTAKKALSEAEKRLKKARAELQALGADSASRGAAVPSRRRRDSRPSDEVV